MAFGNGATNLRSFESRISTLPQQLICKLIAGVLFSRYRESDTAATNFFFLNKRRINCIIRKRKVNCMVATVPWCYKLSARCYQQIIRSYWNVIFKKIYHSFLANKIQATAHIQRVCQGDNNASLWHEILTTNHYFSFTNLITRIVYR